MQIENKVRLDSISELYTADTLAKGLKVSRSMIYYLREIGKIKSYQISPTKYVFKREDVKEYLKSVGYGLHSLIMQNKMSAPDRAELLDKIRDIEDRIEAQLVNRAKGENQRRLFTSNPSLIDRDVKREMIKLRAERESSEKYSHMKLKDLMAKKS